MLVSVSAIGIALPRNRYSRQDRRAVTAVVSTPRDLAATDVRDSARLRHPLIVLTFGAALGLGEVVDERGFIRAAPPLDQIPVDVIGAALDPVGAESAAHRRLPSVSLFSPTATGPCAHFSPGASQCAPWLSLAWAHSTGWEAAYACAIPGIGPVPAAGPLPGVPSCAVGTGCISPPQASHSASW